MPVEDLPPFAQTLLADHFGCINELKQLSGAASSKENNTLSVSWHAPEPGIGLEELQLSYLRSLIVLIILFKRKKCFQKGSLTQIYSK